MSTASKIWIVMAFQIVVAPDPSVEIRSTDLSLSDLIRGTNYLFIPAKCAIKQQDFSIPRRATSQDESASLTTDYSIEQISRMAVTDTVAYEEPRPFSSLAAAVDFHRKNDARMKGPEVSAIVCWSSTTWKQQFLDIDATYLCTREFQLLKMAMNEELAILPPYSHYTISAKNVFHQFDIAQSLPRTFRMADEKGSSMHCYRVGYPNGSDGYVWLTVSEQLPVASIVSSADKSVTEYTQIGYSIGVDRLAHPSRVIRVRLDTAEAFVRDTRIDGHEWLTAGDELRLEIPKNFTVVDHRFHPMIVGRAKNHVFDVQQGKLLDMR